MSNDYYNHGGYPSTSSAGASATARAEFDAIMAGFAKLPVLAASALKLVRVNAGATGLESTSSIDSIVIGGTTPAAGTFTTLSATGNVSLGDAVADTISVGGVVVKGAAGNWALPAPSSGLTLSLAVLPSTAGAQISDGTVTGQWGTITATSTFFGTTSNHGFQLRTNNLDRVDVTAAGNVTISPPTSGTAAALTVNGGNLTDGITYSGLALGIPLTIRDIAALPNNATQAFIGLSTAALTGVNGELILIPRTSTNAGLRVYTGNVGLAVERFSISSTGNSTFLAASVGNTLTVNGVAGASPLVVDGVTTASYVTLMRSGTIIGYMGSGDSMYSGGAANELGVSTVASGVFSIALNGTLSTKWSAAGNVTIAAPSSGATLNVGAVAGADAIISSVALSGSTLEWAIVNTSNTAGSSASQYFAVGGTSAGDPFIRMDITGTQSWAFGIDNSDSDAYVFSASSALGTTNRLRIPTSGAISLLAGAYTPTSSQAFTATPTFDASLSNAFEFSGAMTANVTGVTITNPTAGQTITIRVKQDGTGGRTVATPTGAKISGSVSLTASAASLLTLTYSAMDSRWEGSWLQTPA